MERVFVDTGSSVDVLFRKYLEQMRLEKRMDPVETSLFGFKGESIQLTGQVQVQMVLGEGASRKSGMVKFMIVDAPSEYNVIMG